jgi:Zn-dependent peptidase ImmA (M78 family)
MNLIFDKIIKVFPDFNKREHDANDFWRVAKKEKIIVTEEPLLIPGYYKVEKRKPYILINSNLSPFDWILTAFHELTHHILDVPYKKNSILLYRNVQRLESIQESRAEEIALMLLIPLKRLEELEKTPFDQLHPFTQKLLVKRQRIFESYRR